MVRWLIYLALIYVLYRVVVLIQSDARDRRRRVAEATNREPRVDATLAPHEVLGVEPDASAADVRRAYQRKMREYHPDRVANAAPELRALAERRSKEINAAYAELRRRMR